MQETFQADQDCTIVIHTFTDSSEAAVDAWAAAAARVIEATPPDQVFRLMLDVSARQVSFTLYARQMSADLFTRYRNRRGRLAFLFSSRIAPFYARIFLASLGQLDFEYEYFSKRERAIAWLRDAASARQ